MPENISQIDALLVDARIRSLELDEEESKLAAGKPMNDEEIMYSKKTGISIMSGKGTGKDAFTSWIIIWFLCCFPFCKIPCTANTGKQLKDVLWSEINKWLRGSLVEDWLVWQTEKVYFKEQGGKEWFATARTVNIKASAEQQAEALQGFHEENMMIVVDEASGVPDPVFTPLEDTLTWPVNFVLMIFNPTRRTGYAKDSQYKFKDEWACLHWDAEKSEIVTRDSIEKKERRYGRGSNMFRISVKGLPPNSDPDTLIPPEWVELAINREIDASEQPLVLGVDVGAGGDASIILHRRGNKVTRIAEHHTKDTIEFANWVAEEMSQYEAQAAFIDPIGIGNGVFHTLHRLGYKVYPVDVRRTSRNEDRFPKIRDELWWTLREQFENGTISIVDDQELVSELSDIKYKPLESGRNSRIKVESKEDMRDRGVHSPNKGDALMMTYYLPIELFQHQAAQEKKDKWDMAFEKAQFQSQQRSWMAA